MLKLSVIALIYYDNTSIYKKIYISYLCAQIPSSYRIDYPFMRVINVIIYIFTYCNNFYDVKLHKDILSVLTVHT